MILNIAFFFISCVLLIISGNWLVKSLSRIAGFLNLKEFTVAFILMSLATALPELFVGLGSAWRGVPELSFGNILGQNIIHFTLAVFICVLVRGSFSVRSKTTRITAFFSGFMALFPLILIVDGNLSRSDGLILIFLYFFYLVWVIKKGRRFEEEYEISEDQPSVSIFTKLKIFLSDLGLFLVGTIFLLGASQGVIWSAIAMSSGLNLPLFVTGVLIVGLGTALPEVYFSAHAARKGEAEMMAGNLFGTTVVSNSLILGLVAFLSPIDNIEIFSYLASRLTLLLAVVLFLYFMLTDRKVTLREGGVLFFLYLVFVLIEIWYNNGLF